MPFFPTYKDNYTRTPNLFFDVVLQTKGVSLNEIRLVGYLIRNTLGYNRQSKWVGASRNDLIKYAKIPNGAITDTINKCVKKGWILEFIDEEKHNSPRYIFLNDERNVRIVWGLKKRLFNIDQLKYLNEAGLEKLLEDMKVPPAEVIEKENISSTTEPVEEYMFGPTESVEEHVFGPTESVGQGTTESVGQGTTESVGLDTPSTQESQGVSQPLNTTTTKDTSSNTSSSSRVLESPVEELHKVWQECFGEELDEAGFNDLMDAGPIESILTIVKDIQEYHPNKDNIYQPVGFVIKCVREGGYRKPRKVKKAVATKRQPKQPKAPSKSLPKSMQQQQEQQSTGSTMTEEELAERRRRIKAMMEYMDETLSAKYGPRTPVMS